MIGGISWNTMLYVDSFPEPKPQTVFASSSYSTVGSSGAGKALNLAVLGADVTLWGLLGDDHPGRLVRDYLADRRVRLLADLDPAGTPRHVNLMDKAGDRISIFANAASQDIVVDTEQLRQEAIQADIISLNISNYCRQFIPMLQDIGREIWVDIHDYNGTNPYYDDFIAAADYLFMSSLGTKHWRGFLEEQVASGTTVVVCTHGAAGCSGLTADTGWIEVPAVPVDNVVDTNGAGDGFFAGFSLAWKAGLGFEKSLERGAAAAADAVQSPDLAPTSLRDSYR